MMLAQPVQGRFVPGVFQGGGCIHKATVEKYPVLRVLCGFAISRSHIDSLLRERGHVYPWQRAPPSFEFFRDDPAARFLDYDVTSPFQLSQERGFAAS